MLSIYILRKNNRIHDNAFGEEGGKGGGDFIWEPFESVLSKNNEVFCFLYFYSSKR